MKIVDNAVKGTNQNVQYITMFTTPCKKFKREVLLNS